VLQAIHAAAGQLEQARGPSIAEAFLRAATTNEITLREVSDQWLAGLGRSQEKKTIAGHRKVFTDLERFVRERHGHQSLATMTFPGVTRRMAGEFIAWRGARVSPAAVKREFSAPMGLCAGGYAVDMPIPAPGRIRPRA
jgi:hypothetical protein